MSDYASQIEEEQAHVDAIYNRLDDLAAQTKSRLHGVRAQGGKGSPTHMAERDSFNAMYEDRLTQLRAVQDRLVFGKLDTDEGDSRYIGRIGISSEEHEPMLTDWRAEAARPFYEATAQERMGIIQRRHIALKFRNVVGIEDEVLNVHSERATQASREGTLTGEGALLTSLASRRTGFMTDIVATIQAEQDRIIRQPLNQVVVVQGGPGTGKTAVALHRAAYLLYTHRERLAHSGVLIVGPSSNFLHYIGQVLPSLGETGVLSRTMATLLPGVTVSAEEEPHVAQLKGDARMARMIDNAVKACVRVPSQLPTISVRGTRIAVTAEDIISAQNAARHSHAPHNKARVTFIERMMELLVARYQRAVEYQPSATELDQVRESLRMDQAVQRTLNLAWLPLTAQWLLETLWARPQRLKRAAPWLSDEQLRLLYREKGSGWTVSDIPLLDEAMELIGPDPNKAAALNQKKGPSAEERYAQETLESMGLAKSGLVNAADLAAQMNGTADGESLISHAARDREWTFGHIVVDEAQELSAMDWRMLLRRCPSRSFTIVGDVAQTSALGGTRHWQDTMNPLFGEDRWNLCELTIDYRNPQEVATLADEYARSRGLYISTVHSVRQIPDSVRRVTVENSNDLVPSALTQIIEMVKRYVSDDGTGRVAVIADTSILTLLRQPLWKAIREQLGEQEEQRLRNQDDWDDQIDLIDPHGSKGLEYDAVVVIEPGLIEENGASRLSAAADLYVAMTRPTQQLVIVRTRSDAEQVNL